jgi:hypothetical protein
LIVAPSGGCDERFQIESLAEYRSENECRFRRWGQPFQTLRNQRRDRRRRGRPAGSEVAHGLDQQQRHAIHPAGHAAESRIVDGVRQHTAGRAGRVFGRKPIEHDLRRKSGTRELSAQFAQRMSAGQIVVARRHDEQHRCAVEAAGNEVK